jgi:uncharacterized membrane protein (TIGR02234 family)
VTDPVAGEQAAGEQAAGAPSVRPRSYSIALASLAIGAVLLFLASGRTWATLLVADPGLPSLTVTITGSELTYGAPLALLALAGIAGLVALRRAGRVVAGVVLILCALPAGVSTLVFGLTHATSTGAGDWIAAIAGEKAGVAVDGSSAAVSWWWLVELVGVLLVLLAGVLAVVASRRWPALGRRYERDGEQAPAPGSSSRAAAPAAPLSAWDQLDAGVDPTLDPPTGASQDAAADGIGSAEAQPDDPNRAT